MLWINIIRFLAAVHFHVAPHDIDEIDYWAPHAQDVSHVWQYPDGDDDCNLYTWGRYDVCIVHDAKRVHHSLKFYRVPAQYRHRASK